MEEQSFDTREALLALSLSLAGCEPLDAAQPCFNLFDEEILAKLGYRGSHLFESAKEAWDLKEKGDVGYVFQMSPRLPDLVLAYRDQAKQIEELADGTTAKSLLIKILGQHELGAVMEDEMILRISCVILKTRGQYVNLWKQMVPLLRAPVAGRTKHFDDTILSKGRLVEAKGVKKPGFQVVSLNISDEHRKAMRL